MSEIEVTFHPHTKSELFDTVLESYPTLAANLQRDLKIYLATGQLFPHFGKVEIYTQPPLAYAAKLWHMHLALPPDTFRATDSQMFRVCKKGKPGKDAALVYAQGLFEEHRYCILAVLHPDAHGKAREEKIMRFLAHLAKEFRDAN